MVILIDRKSDVMLHPKGRGVVLVVPTVPVGLPGVVLRHSVARGSVY